MPGAVHRDVTASGVRLRVVEAGSGPPVVLIHGLFVDHTSWDLVMPELSDAFRVVALDLPGFGASEKPPPSRFPYGIDAFAEAIADLYAGLELGPAMVVGHALGGAIALTLAARHPELVSRLTLIDPLCYESNTGRYGQLARLPFVGGVMLKQLWGRGLFRRHFQETVFGPTSNMPAPRIDRYYDAFNAPAARSSALATLRSTVDTRGIVAQTSRIQAPTLVIWGRHDRVWPASFGQRLAREIRGSGFELLDSGHSPHEERPQEIVRILRRFLTDERKSRF
ncbi:MAG TPA: alpha/beta fold hydrolase [Polyangiaceae bacterium]|jgi:pimeloyl-ACP methyl ester carboxylesterase|nr:alpha/beta fold hydrolase [Polyangiaceae bacterium]